MWSGRRLPSIAWRVGSTPHVGPGSGEGSRRREPGRGHRGAAARDGGRNRRHGGCVTVSAGQAGPSPSRNGRWPLATFRLSRPGPAGSARRLVERGEATPRPGRCWPLPHSYDTCRGIKGGDLAAARASLRLCTVRRPVPGLGRQVVDPEVRGVGAHPIAARRGRLQELGAVATEVDGQAPFVH